MTLFSSNVWVGNDNDKESQQARGSRRKAPALAEIPSIISYLFKMLDINLKGVLIVFLFLSHNRIQQSYSGLLPQAG